MDNPEKIIALLGMGQVVLFIVLILFKKKKQIKDYLLALTLLMIGAEFFYRFTATPISGQTDNRIIVLDLVYWAILGPSTLLYIDFLVHPDLRFRRKHLMHLAPLIIIMIPYTRYLMSGNTQDTFFIYASRSDLFNVVMIYIWDWITPFYLIATLFRIKTYRKEVYSFFSNIRKKDLRWAFYLTGGLMIYFLVTFLLLYLGEFGLINFPYSTATISVVVLELYVLGVGIYGYRQEGIFSEYIQTGSINPGLVSKVNTENTNGKKYERSGLNILEGQEIAQQLKVLMRTDKPFINCDLTINDLAGKLDTSFHKLSQVINENFHQNFYEFVNTYRVEEVKKYLNDPDYDHLKIISLAWDCGFNSKSAFYNAFKKITGETPTEYRSRVQKETYRIGA